MGYNTYVFVTRNNFFMAFTDRENIIERIYETHGLLRITSELESLLLHEST